MAEQVGQASQQQSQNSRASIHGNDSGAFFTRIETTAATTTLPQAQTTAVLPNNSPRAINDADGQGTNRFSAVRDRLFQAMLVKFAIVYSRRVPYRARVLIEFTALLHALALLFLLCYVHYVSSMNRESCLTEIKASWPQKGVVRVEVIRNLDEVFKMKAKIQEIKNASMAKSRKVTTFKLEDVFLRGPSALPRELRHRPPMHNPLVVEKSPDTNNTHEIDSIDSNSFWVDFFESTVNFFYEPFESLSEDLSPIENEFEKEEFYQSLLDQYEDKNELMASIALPMEFPNGEPAYVYIAEYSLHYGLLRLSPYLRREYNIPVMLIQLDANNEKCFGNWKNRLALKRFIGYEDIIMSSLRTLAENETEKGYIRDIITGEHYHFVTSRSSRITYLTALLIMLVFTFAISMLLRFSHHQIFLFIIDLLQMFEMNQQLVFPIAPLLTVILALVGMEAIMSEIFNDTSTAFYVILLVWVADQYDAICCHSSIGRRFWLRFFYLYHFAFYVHQYRYSGQYAGLTLLTSIAFILHSMIYFFHHYELPHIIYQERLQTVVGTLHHHTATNNGTATLSVRLRVSTTSRQEQPTMVNQTSAAENRIPAAAADSTSTPPSLNNEVNFENSSSSIEYANAEPIPDDSSADESTSVEQRVAEELVSVAFHDLFGGSGDSNITSRV